MAFNSLIDISGSALTTQRCRIDIILQNIANEKTTVTKSGDPYRRKQVVYQEEKLSFNSQLNKMQGGVKIKEVVESDRDFNIVYDPTHPQANEDGYVKFSNVDTTEEMIDLMAASNAYEANLATLSVVKSMITKTLELNK